MMDWVGWALVAMYIIMPLLLIYIEYDQWRESKKDDSSDE